jgi:hypothetical protein
VLLWLGGQHLAAAAVARALLRLNISCCGLWAVQVWARRQVLSQAVLWSHSCSHASVRHAGAASVMRERQQHPGGGGMFFVVLCADFDRPKGFCVRCGVNNSVSDVVLPANRNQWQQTGAAAVICCVGLWCSGAGDVGMWLCWCVCVGPALGRAAGMPCVAVKYCRLLKHQQAQWELRTACAAAFAVECHLCFHTPYVPVQRDCWWAAGCATHAHDFASSPEFATRAHGLAS